uniref:Uncharacterized protein n=1 Tax=Sphaerodactylus townsendi TaxID=933632 RepID=A0ACB8F239_9SAUR
MSRWIQLGVSLATRSYVDAFSHLGKDMPPTWVVAVASLVFLRTSAAAQDLALEEAWKEWKGLHTKEYLEEEEAFRRAVWEKNLQRIELHNLEASLGKHSYRLAMNHLGDLTEEEINRRLNGFHPGPVHRHGENRVLFHESTSLESPKEVDWRKKGYITPVKNQGHCGACWAFSATGALEGLLFNKTGKLVSLSEQNLIDCSGKLGNHGCHGGYITRAFEYVRDNKGINSEDAYPYMEKEGFNCRYNPRERAANCTSLVAVQRGSEAALEQAVATIGPVSVAVDAHHFPFHFYKSGIFSNVFCSNVVNHAMLAVGYGTSQGDGKAYWILKNR